MARAASRGVLQTGRSRRRRSGLDAGDAGDALDRAQLLDDSGQVHAVMHADHQLDDADAAVALVHADLLDVAVGGIDAAGEQGDQAALVLQLDPELDIRSEEHTSELQSLMRISYAVFCLKKKNIQQS